MSLFGGLSGDPWDRVPPDAPLAERMRPTDIDEIVGQDHILGKGKWLREAIEADRVPSLILWGPPGTGKTTLARVIARATKADFVPFSAVLSGVKDVKAVMARARRGRDAGGRKTILFVDEIHRFNKAQQDAFLPYVERGDVVLVGATTENPSFEVVGALLSRARVLVLKPLEEEDLLVILRKALADEERGLGKLGLEAEEGALEAMALFGSGDARRSLGLLEEAAKLTEGRGEKKITREITKEAAGSRTLLYDKSGEEHFNLISAFHKSLRSSDPQAALYWFERMLASGEDPLYVARRMVRFAVEDIGLADPGALKTALAAKEAFEFLGLPEGKLALAQAVVYLAVAPRSNSVYAALQEVEKEVREGRADPVPLQVRNAPTDLMRRFGYGKGYEHAHDVEGKVPAMECLPDRLAGRVFYRPTMEGLEERIAKRLAWIEEARKRARKK